MNECAVVCYMKHPRAGDNAGLSENKRICPRKPDARRALRTPAEHIGKSEEDWKRSRESLPGSTVTSGVFGNPHWPGKGLEPRRPMLVRGGRYLPVCTLRLMSTFGYISSLFHTSHTLKRYHSQLNSCESITFSAIAPIELLNLDSQLEP